MTGSSDPHTNGGGPVQLPSPTLSPVLERPFLFGEGSHKAHDAVAEESTKKPSTKDAIEEEMEEERSSGVSGKATAALRGNAANDPILDYRKQSIGRATSPIAGIDDREKVLRLSSAQIQELTASPTSLPLRAVSNIPDISLVIKSNENRSPVGQEPDRTASPGNLRRHNEDMVPGLNLDTSLLNATRVEVPAKTANARLPEIENIRSTVDAPKGRPALSRNYSTPPAFKRKPSNRSQGSYLDSQSRLGRPLPPPLHIASDKGGGAPVGTLKPPSGSDSGGSPMLSSIPLPPLSIPTYLQLELAADRPSPLYIYRPAASDFPYESARIRYERLLNFLLLPPQLEQAIVFGFFACLDAWLYSFTILPLRFFKALYVLADWMVRASIKEVQDIGSFIYWGLGRVWQRRRFSDTSAPPTSAEEVPPVRVPISRRSSNISTSPSPRTPALTIEQSMRDTTVPEPPRRSARSSAFKHRRTKSKPSLLMPTHKADILRGLLIVASCFILMRLDASRMYHSIRGQAAIKLYVIYNVLEVCDRLFSALGQDVLECLFSRETLERNPDGRSKILVPFWMFLLALVYNVIHSTALFYQVITLNVAVNSYSNALLTLLMSNQFVEIKGTVFKKFEKENLFQITCADIVERFQLSLMLSIIVLRNVFEVGVLGLSSNPANSGSSLTGNATHSAFKSSSIIPRSFTVFPNIGGQVLGPFLLVLGSECLVDWLKHAYITKFNNTKPAVYGRFLDILAKDYYSHAFADQNLTKRLGLPVIPLSCLFIRAMVQTYRMFIETHMPIPLASHVTGLTTDSASTSSPATTAALAHIDQVFRRALGRSSFGAGMGDVTSSFSWWSMDDLIAFATMLVVWLLAWFVLLSIKLVLGMLLLSFARKRYTKMKEREKLSVDTGGKRVGGWGVVEVDDDKRRWVYADDKEGLQKLKERDTRIKENEEKGWDGSELNSVSRYSMIAKRIW